MVAVSRLGKTTISRQTFCVEYRCRKLSLTTRFILLRPTARLSTWRDTAMPRREFSSWFKRARILKHRSVVTKGFLKTLLNSMAFLSLCLLVNAAPLDGFAFLPTESAPDIMVCLLRSGFCCDSVCPGSGRQTLSTLRSTGLDD